MANVDFDRDERQGVIDLKHSLQEMEEVINEIIDANQTAAEMMLVAPLTLTVKTDEGYRKWPHIGGERFSLTGVYFGKRNTPIFVFTPLEASKFKVAELSQSDASSAFTEFVPFLKTTGIDEVLADVGELRREAKKQSTMKSKTEQYGGSWGEW